MRTHLKESWLCIFLIFLFSLSLVNKNIDTGYDFGWQVKAGETTLSESKILMDDTFSWVEESKKDVWMNQEWGFEVIMKVMSKSPITYYLFSLAINFLLMGLALSLALKYRAANSIYLSVISILLGLLLSTFYTVRPYIWGLILFLIEIHIFEHLKRKPDSKVIYALPFMGILWINGHGGSASLLYIVAFIYIITSSFKVQYGKLYSKVWKPKILIRNICITIASMLAMVINPYGFKMLLYPYTNIMDNQMTTYITEWHSPIITQWPDLLIFIVFIICIGCLCISLQRLNITDLCLLGFCMVMSLVSYRHVMFLWAISYMMIFKYSPESKEIFKRANIYILLFINTLFITVTLDNQIKFKPFISDAIMEEISFYQPKSIFNDYDIGGFLILNNIPVFVDGRYELYRNKVFKDYFKILNMEPEAIDLMKEYEFDSFLIRKDSYLERYLRSENQYELVCKEDNLKLCFYILGKNKLEE